MALAASRTALERAQAETRTFGKAVLLRGSCPSIRGHCPSICLFARPLSVYPPFKVCRTIYALDLGRAKLVGHRRTVVQRRAAGGRGDGAGCLAHRVKLNGFRKSIPPQNREQIVNYYSPKNKLTIVWGS